MKSALSTLGLVFMGLVTISLTACNEVDVVNGEVPDQYAAAAAKYMGTYQQIGTAGQMTISVVDKKVVVSTDFGLIDSRCAAKIGDLKAVKASEKDGQYTLNRARFAFDPNFCSISVEGKELVLTFAEKHGKLFARGEVLSETKWTRVCRLDPGPAGRGPSQVCEVVPERQYYDWNFQKQ